MNPQIITFTTMEEFKRLMVYAAREKMYWFRQVEMSETAPEGITAGVLNYLRVQGSCAICFEEDGQLGGYSPVAYFRNAPAYSYYEFKTAKEILDMGVDCTIPENV